MRGWIWLGVLVLAACGGDDDGGSGGGSSDAGETVDGSSTSDGSMGGSITVRPSTATLCEGPLTVDESGYVGQHIAVSATSAGSHIAYHYPDYGTWHYASNTAGEWSHSNVIPSNETGAFISAASEADGSIHVAYFNGIGKDLIYATNDSGTWQDEPVDTEGDVGFNTAIDVSADGSIHIVYTDELEQVLKYASNTSGSWQAEMVDGAPEKVSWPSVAIDADGHAHVAYQDKSNEVLRYASNSTGSWMSTPVDDGQLAGEATQIDIDPQGTIRIAYQKGSVHLADPATGQIQTFPSSVSSGRIGMRFDGNGHVHLAFLAFVDEVTSELRYLSNADGDHALDFGSITIGTGGLSNPIGWPSLAVDADKAAHIAYWSEGDGYLEFAKVCP